MRATVVTLTTGVAAVGAVLFAQTPAQETLNRQIALRWVREAPQNGNFIEHDPNKPAIPVKLTPNQVPVAVLGQADYVLVAFEQTGHGTKDPSKTYSYTRFDVMRLQDGRVAEHWNSETRMPPPAYPSVQPPNAADHSDEPLDAALYGAPADVPQDLINRQLALDWFRILISYRHVERAADFMVEEYKQHNPNVRAGRAAFVENFGSRPPATLKPGIGSPPSRVFSRDGLVALMFDRQSPDPQDPTMYYGHNHFDMVKIVGGKIVEHWDEARLRE